MAEVHGSSQAVAHDRRELRQRMPGDVHASVPRMVWRRLLVRGFSGWISPSATCTLDRRVTRGVVARMHGWEYQACQWE